MELKILEEEVCLIVKEFSTSLGFLNVDSMRETASQFKMFIMPDESHDSSSASIYENTDNNKDAEIISQKLNKSRRSMIIASRLILSSDDEEDKVSSKVRQSTQYKPRKSRKSVCVAPQMISSSSEESDVELKSNSVTSDENLTDIETEVDSSIVNNEPESVIDGSKDNESYLSDDDDNCIKYRSKKKANKLESSSDEEIEDTQANSDPLKKRITYESVSDDNNGNDDEKEAYNSNTSHKDPEVSELTQKFHSQTICDEDSDDEGDYVASDLETNESGIEQTDSEDSMKKFVVSDNDRESNSRDESEEEEEVDEGDDDVFKTPIFTPKNKGVLKQNYQMQTMVTPFSATKRILNQIQTPKSVPGTPAYKRQFKKIREDVVKQLFHLYNKTVFDNKLPTDLEITWNNRMTKTAGFCYYSKMGTKYLSRIELSDKVLDCTERVRDTLIHELCHAATWLINGVRDGHGAQWKYWATKANKIHPDLPIIMRCHAYKINGKFSYVCNGCGLRFERFSKSIKPDKHRCGECGGIPELVNPTPKKTENPYCTFVKENFSTVKQSNPGMSHKECMMKISDMFKVHKAGKDKENICL